MAVLDIWCLRRHCRELAVQLAHRPAIQRVCEFSQGDWGLIARDAAGERGLLRVRCQPQQAGLAWQTAWDDPIVEPVAFGAALDRRLRDARLLSLSVTGWDRVVALDFVKSDSVLGGATKFRLVLEFTGRVTNALLLDAEGIVLDQWNHRTQNGIRKHYASPPVAPDRLDPLAAPADQVATVLRAPTDVWADRIHGFNPRLTRELVHRLRDPGTDPGAVWAGLVRDLDGSCSIHVYATGARVQAIATVPLSHLGAAGREFATVNAALTWIDTEVVGSRDLDALRERALQRWRREIVRVEAAVGDEKARLESYRHADDHRRAGELILAYLHQIAPRARAVELPGFEDGASVTVELDPLKSPADNAKAYFHRYKKARRGLAASQRRIDTLVGELNWLREQEFLCTQAERAADLEAMLRSDSAATRRRSRSSEQAAVGDRKQAKTLKPLLEIDGCRFYVGRNARHNDLITFHVGRRGDIWLHAHEVPGSHVLVRRPGAVPNEDDVRRGAVLAAWFSAARQGGNVVVDATDVGTVKRIPGGGPGRVSFRPQQSLRVDPREAETLLTQGGDRP